MVLAANVDHISLNKTARQTHMPEVSGVHGCCNLLDRGGRRPRTLSCDAWTGFALEKDHGVLARLRQAHAAAVVICCSCSFWQAAGPCHRRILPDFQIKNLTTIPRTGGGACNLDVHFTFWSHKMCASPAGATRGYIQYQLLGFI
jgi:hypothetical protein